WLLRIVRVERHSLIVLAALGRSSQCDGDATRCARRDGRLGLDARLRLTSGTHRFNGQGHTAGVFEVENGMQRFPGFGGAEIGNRRTEMNTWRGAVVIGKTTSAGKKDACEHQCPKRRVSCDHENLNEDAA